MAPMLANSTHRDGMPHYRYLCGENHPYTQSAQADFVAAGHRGTVSTAGSSDMYGKPCMIITKPGANRLDIGLLRGYSTAAFGL
jgi:hypothetical protein